MHMKQSFETAVLQRNNRLGEVSRCCSVEYQRLPPCFVLDVSGRIATVEEEWSSPFLRDYDSVL